MSGKKNLPRWVFAADIVAGILAVFIIYLLSRNQPALLAQGRDSFTILDILFYSSFILIDLTDSALAGDYNRDWRYSRVNEALILLRSAFLAFVLLVSSAFILEGIALADEFKALAPGSWCWSPVSCRCCSSTAWSPISSRRSFSAAASGART